MPLKSRKGSTVRPACKVRGFVQEKLTIQEGFSTLTLEQGNFIMFMPLWCYAKLTLHPFWPYISGSYKRGRLYNILSKGSVLALMYFLPVGRQCTGLGGVSVGVSHFPGLAVMDHCWLSPELRCNPPSTCPPGKTFFLLLRQWWTDIVSLLGLSWVSERVIFFVIWTF